MLVEITLMICAYLLGSLSSAIIVCRLLGLEDPRSDGSGNPGATNVLRLHGKKAALPTLLGDLVKGWLPVCLGQWLAVPPPVLAATGLAVFCGHLFPVFFGFKGGKGVATFIGVLFGVHWPLGLAFVAIWLIMALLFRYSSLAALAAAAAAPVYTALLMRGFEQPPSSALWFVGGHLLMALLLFWRHAGNIRKLISGAEERLFSS